jgi:hypothetical protein
MCPINSASGHPIRHRPAHCLLALRALASDSTLGYTGAPDLPPQRFGRATDRAPSVATLPLTLVASLIIRSRALFSHVGLSYGRARMLPPRFVSARPRAASVIVPYLGRWQSGHSRASRGLTLRSTGRAGTCFHLRSPSARRAGYLDR